MVGIISKKERFINNGKNIGKKNETTIQEQAELELSYLYQKQLDQGYVFDIERYVEPVRPMLAHKYNDKKHLLIWNSLKENNKPIHDNVFASRKLNGIRCFIFVKNNEVTLFESRSGKSFKFFSHIANEINDFNFPNKNYILDGELFNKDIPFEILCSLINSDEYVSIEYNGNIYTTDMVQFHCYDCIFENNLEENYYYRFIDNNWLNIEYSYFKKVDNILITSEEQMYETTKRWMDEGYEGLMLRCAWMSYEFGRRSVSLLKVKLFESEEFQIKDIYLAENDNTKVMFILYNHHNNLEPYNIFDCSIKGNKEFNMEYYNNKQKYIGKWATVPYQALSSYNVPLFAQIEIIRDGEIINGKFEPTQ